MPTEPRPLAQSGGDPPRFPPRGERLPGNRIEYLPLAPDGNYYARRGRTWLVHAPGTGIWITLPQRPWT